MKKHFEKIIFSTVNDASESSALLPLSVDMEFDSIHVELMPPSMMLSGKSGVLCFDYVKQIDVSDESESMICALLRCVSCGISYLFRVFFVS